MITFVPKLVCLALFLLFFAWSPLQSQFQITPVPIEDGGKTNVSANAIPVLEDPSLGQYRAGHVPLRDSNEVHLFSEEFFHQRHDLRLSGIGVDVEFTRTYRSRLNYNGPMGQGWTHAYNQFLIVGAETQYVNGSAQVIDFDSSFPVNSNEVMTLEQLPDSSFELRYSHGSVKGFLAPNAAGIARLSFIRDRVGNVLLFNYNGAGRLSQITDTFGRTITLQYYSKGRLRSVQDPMGRRWTYRYDMNDDLVAVDSPKVGSQSNTVSYTYVGNSHNMEDCSYPEGLRFTNTYNVSGGLEAHQRGAGAWQFFYSDEPGSSTRTGEVFDPNGNHFFHVMNDGTALGLSRGTLKEMRQVLDRGIDPGIPTGITLTTQYLSSGNCSIIVSPDGRGSHRYYESGRPQSDLAWGNVRIRREESNDPATTDTVEWKEFDPRYNRVKYSVSAEAFPNGNPSADCTPGQFLDLDDPLVQDFLTTRYFDYEEMEQSFGVDYDGDGSIADVDHNGDGIIGPDFGNVVREVLPGGAERMFHYNDFGRRLEAIDENGYRRRYFYWPATDAGGRNSLEADLVSNLSTPTGRLARVVTDYFENPLANDPRTGRPHVNAGDLRRFDGRGNVVEYTDALGNVTVYEYDLADRRTKEIKPSPFLHEIRYEYNQNGMQTKVLKQNVRSDGSLDPDNPWVEENREFDAWDRTTKSRQESSEGAFLERRFYYDKNENLVLQSTPKASSGNNSAAIWSWVYGELGGIYSMTQGGVTAQFSSLPAHDHIDVSALGFITSPLAVTSTIQYDIDGLEVKTIAADGGETLTIRDGLGRPKEEIRPAGDKTVFTYDQHGKEKTRTTYDEDGNLTGFREKFYNSRLLLTCTEETFFRLDRSQSPPVSIPLYTDGDGDGIVVRTNQYDAAGRLTDTVNDQGVARFTIYDGADREILIATPTVAKEFHYDAMNNLKTAVRYETEPLALKTLTQTFEYDELGRRTSRTDPLLHQVGYEYDSLGHLVTYTDELGNQTHRVFDGAGRLLTETMDLRAGGTGAGALQSQMEAHHVYDENGKLIEFTDGAGNKVKVSYDALDRREQIQHGDELAGPVDITTATHASDGTLQFVTDANGTTVEHLYDDNQRVIGKIITPASGVDSLVTNVTYEYDDSGLLLMADNGYSRIDREYDSLKRLVKETLTVDARTFTTEATFDGVGNRLSMAYPSNLSLEEIPAPARKAIQEIRVNGVPRFTFEYAGGDRVLERQSLSSASWQSSLAYDNANRPTSRQSTFLAGGSGPLPGLIWNRDAFGRKTDVLRIESGLGDQYFRDSVGQLTRVQEDVPAANLPNPMTTSYARSKDFVYDLARNRQHIFEDGVGLMYSTNSRNQYTSIGVSPLTYDGNGNLVSYGGRTYEYDYENRLRRVVQGTTVLAQFFYDALGRRIKKVTPAKTEYELWFQNQQVESREVTGPGTYKITELIQGTRLDEVLLLRVDGVEYFLLNDDLGSATHVLDANGVVVESYRYAAFGAPTILDGNGNPLSQSSVGSSARFAGRPFDVETGLYFVRARYYSPTLGRFLSRDPSGLEGGRNLYVYASNSPWTMIDPFGLQDHPIPSDLGSGFDFDDYSNKTRNAVGTTATGVLTGIAYTGVILVLVAGGPGFWAAYGTFLASGALFGLELSRSPVEYDQLGSFAVNITTTFNDKIGPELQSIFEQHQGSAAGTQAGDLPPGIQSITTREYEDGTGDKYVIVETADGSSYHIDDEGWVGLVPDGNGGFHHVEKNNATGELRIRFSDGTVIRKFANGNIIVCPSGEDCIKYNAVGKKIGECKNEAECEKEEGVKEEEETEEEDPPEGEGEAEEETPGEDPNPPPPPNGDQ